MNAILQFHKKRYETPLEMLERLRVEQPELKHEKLSYLGRLDPLAHGVVLIAVGEANKDREKYLNLSKRYKVSFLFGVSTDSGDVLGVITDTHDQNIPKGEKIVKEILQLRGEHTLPYPMYSSKTVQGKPLHEYAREGKEVRVPERNMEIMSITCNETYTISGEELAQSGIEATERIKGDFRQEAIRKTWEEFRRMYQGKTFLVAKAELAVSSGTYMRSLADLLKERAGIPCVAYDIERAAYLL